MLHIPTLNNETELAAAIMTVFFYGNMTQKAVNLLIKLINIISVVQVPSKFDNVLSILLKNSKLDETNYEKRWYCETCFKLCEVAKENRFQRDCNTCKSKYTHILIGLKIFYYRFYI